MVDLKHALILQVAVSHVIEAHCNFLDMAVPYRLNFQRIAAEVPGTFSLDSLRQFANQFCRALAVVLQLSFAFGTLARARVVRRRNDGQAVAWHSVRVGTEGCGEGRRSTALPHARPLADHGAERVSAPGDSQLQLLGDASATDLHIFAQCLGKIVFANVAFAVLLATGSHWTMTRFLAEIMHVSLHSVEHELHVLEVLRFKDATFFDGSFWRRRLLTPQRTFRMLREHIFDEIPRRLREAVVLWTGKSLAELRRGVLVVVRGMLFDVEDVLAVQPRLVVENRFAFDQPCLELFGDVLHSAVLIHAHDVHLQVEMRRADLLVLRATSESCPSTHDTAHRAHVASELVLTAVASTMGIWFVAPRAIGTHSNAQEPRESQLYVDEKAFHDRMRISHRSSASQIVLGQLEQDVSFFLGGRRRLELWIVFRREMLPVRCPVLQKRIIAPEPREAQHERRVLLVGRYLSIRFL